jgi:7,8-dihydropterin-6-yl-methyl-4-(beta-D-ribofuranosyl)aminobenzene 5'-phosphate synthase
LSDLSLEEIKKLLKEYPLKRDREIISKILEGAKLSQSELVRGFHMSLPIFNLILLNKRFERNKQLAEKEWSTTKIKKMDNLGTIKHLEITPLIDYHAEGNFHTEEGVSYYIKADNTSILFDTGLNDKDKHPSPLLKNMKALSIKIEDFNYIFISHLHGDHVGGSKWVQNKTFSLSGTQLNLSHVKAFTPVSMNHPTATVSQVTDPEVIANGIASIGSIRNPFFFFKEVFEQSLAINVEGKGIIIIVGCGHQGIQKIIDRTEALFDTPIYGIIGGMHLPIPEFPGDDITWSGLPIYKFIVTRRPPWEPWHKDDRDYTLDYIKARNPKLVALSPHDSSMESINAFKDTFKEVYTELKVGKTIKIA